MANTGLCAAPGSPNGCDCLARPPQQPEHAGVLGYAELKPDTSQVPPGRWGELGEGSWGRALGRERACGLGAPRRRGSCCGGAQEAPQG